MAPPAPPDILALSIGDLADYRESVWLGSSELEHYASLHVPKRKREWLAGRVAAKELVRRRYGLAGNGTSRSIEIVAQPKRRPSYRIASQPARFGLSISHSGGVALAALGQRPHEWVGVDIEQVETRGAGFESLLLSRAETAALKSSRGTERARALTRIWVLKEAVSKALGLGLGFPLPLLESGLGPGDPQTMLVHVPREISARAGSPPCSARVWLFELGALWGACATISGGRS